MAAPRRKLSFIGYAPPGVGDDEAAGGGALDLHDEMQHAVWGAALQEEEEADAGSGRRAAGARKLSLQEHRAPPPPYRAAVEESERREARRRAHSLLPPEAPAPRAAPAVFVQLDELLGGCARAAGASDGEDEEAAAAAPQWRQRARWIKYEQDAEEGAGRWGRPHVASLSFHSLLNLRRALADGALQLQAAAADAGGALEAAAAALAAAGLLAAHEHAPLLAALRRPHSRLPPERSRRFSLSSRKHASYTSLQSLWGEAGAGRRRSASAAQAPAATPGARGLRRSLGGSAGDGRRRRSSHAPPAERKLSVRGALAAAAAATAAAEAPPRARADSLLRRVPPDAEAALALVGAVDFLQRPAAAFVRLQRAVPMPDATEVPVPVRFLFVLLGPAGAELDYREVGRALCTLLVDPDFHALACRAQDRRALLAGINEFLDDSIVLPPGDWERQELLPLDELRAKSEHIRRRKLRALQRRASAASATPPGPPAPPAPPGPPGAPRDEEKALLAADDAPRKPHDDPLERTGRIFGGVVRDVRRRFPHYWADLRDGLDAQCAAAAVFMYFAALSSAVTFGGLYADKTRGQIGIPETLLATCAGGVAFALLAGQPLMITGATGPLLLLDDALAAGCRAAGLDFLAMRAVSGAWMLLLALLVAAAEGSVAVKRITRFTEDIFAFLICLIFISEPITNLVSVYRAHPLGADYCAPDAAPGNGSLAGPAVPGDAAGRPQPNTALFCTMLTLGTFAIAYCLRVFRNGKFLGRSARRALGDFGVPLAIVLMVLLAAATPVWTERLRVPPGLAPSAPRAWLVPAGRGFAELPPWALLAAAAPALMVYIIVFMETHIAELIVDKPERKLVRGGGFHMDIVLLSGINAACALLGAPWQCVATVRSVSHVAALTELSTTHAPGDKPHIVRVREQRVTGLAVAALVGLSVLAAGALRRVPLAVLFGVFLYMGVSALAGMQLWERAVLLLKPAKYHPATAAYVRAVPTRRMHAYTLLQLGALAALLALKASRAALALPLLLAAMVPLRALLLPRLFPPQQLRALDPPNLAVDLDDEPDFYEEAPLPG